MNLKRFNRPNEIQVPPISNVCEIMVEDVSVDASSNELVSNVSVKSVDFSIDADVRSFDLFRVVKTGNLDNLHEVFSPVDTFMQVDSAENAFGSLVEQEKKNITEILS